MEHPSTFDLMIEDALLRQINVMAKIDRDIGGTWCVKEMYADAMSIAGKPCTNSRDWVSIPISHFLHTPVLMHFLGNCRREIDARWEIHGWRYPGPKALRAVPGDGWIHTGERASMFNDAGRTLE